jgi:hypothetical protein
MEIHNIKIHKCFIDGKFRGFVINCPPDENGTHTFSVGMEELLIGMRVGDQFTPLNLESKELIEVDLNFNDKAEIKSLKQQIYDEGWRNMNSESALRADLKTALFQRDTWIQLAKKKGYFN